MLLHERIALQEGATTIGDLFEITRKPRGLDVSRFEAIPFVPMDAIPQGGAFTPRYDARPVEQSGAGTYFEKDDVLVGKITPSFENGKQALVSDLPAPFGFATTEVIPLRPKDIKRDRRLLFYYLLHPDIRSFVAGNMEGATGRQRVPEDVLLNLPFPAFGEDEEDSIADCLNLVRNGAKIENDLVIKSMALKQIALRDLFTRGLLGEAQKETEFGDIPESWIIAPLDDHAQVQTVAAKGRKFGDADTVDVPYLRVANVQDGHLDLREMKTIQIRKSEIERYRLHDGDVVLTEGGDFDKLGRGFIWRNELDLCVHQNHVFAVRPDRECLIPEFFAYLAQSAYGKAYFLKVAHKTTNLACINSAKLKAFPLLIPPTFEEQAEIVAILDAIDAKIDLHKRKKLVLEQLFQALLQKLMTGEVRVADLDLSALKLDQEAAA